MVLSEKLSCIAVDPQGAYCAGGTSQGRIYLWEVDFDLFSLEWRLHLRTRLLQESCSTPGMLITEKSMSYASPPTVRP